MLVLTDTQAELCHKYVDQLYAWNRRINLTSVDLADAWSRHVDESVALAAELPAGTRRVADIGSGGGIPGIILAIANPDAEVALVEADQRKAGFLMHVSGLLRLANVEVIAERAESAGQRPAYHETFDVAVSRAAGPVRQVIEWSEPFVRPGGLILVMSDEELEGFEQRNGVVRVQKQ